MSDELDPPFKINYKVLNLSFPSTAYLDSNNFAEAAHAWELEAEEANERADQFERDLRAAEADLQLMRAAAEAVEKLHARVERFLGSRCANYCLDERSNFQEHPCDTYKANRGES